MSDWVRSVGKKTIFGVSLILLTAISLACTQAGTYAFFAGQTTTTVWLPVVARQAALLNAQRLTALPGDETQPALSPDQRAVLFVKDGDIYSMTLASGEAVNLTRSATVEETPIFAPTGEYIAFASNRDGNWGIYRMGLDGSAVEPLVDHADSDEQNPAFLPMGEQLLFASNRAAGNWDIYSTTIGSPTWVRLTTGAERERYPTVSASGSTIAFRREVTTASGSANSEIFVMDRRGGNLQRLTHDPGFDGQPVITPDGSGVLFVANSSNGKRNIYAANLGGVTQALPKPIYWQLETPRFSQNGEWLVLAGAEFEQYDLFLRSFSSPLQQVAQRAAVEINTVCDWEASMAAYGWARAWSMTQSLHYIQMLQTWVDSCLAANEAVDHVNDGLLGYAALTAYEWTGVERYLQYAQAVADYLFEQAERTPTGALVHLANTQTVWDDTLVSVVPFLVKMSRVHNEARYLDEAVNQFLAHAAVLQNATTGLYHHAWDAATNRYIGGVYWARGNSWPMIAASELLAALPADNAQRNEVLASLRRQANALLPLQQADGRWPTVLNRPDFYLETSGSAQIAMALLTGVAAGWLDAEQFGEAAQRARFGVWRQVQSDGTVSGVSAPTGPMQNEVDYNNISISPFEYYGQGALLVMATAPIP